MGRTRVGWVEWNETKASLAGGWDSPKAVGRTLEVKNLKKGSDPLKLGGQTGQTPFSAWYCGLANLGAHVKADSCCSIPQTGAPCSGVVGVQANL
jgi:hypothetical protein